MGQPAWLESRSKRQIQMGLICIPLGPRITACIRVAVQSISHQYAGQFGMYGVVWVESASSPHTWIQSYSFGLKSAVSQISAMNTSPPLGMIRLTVQPRKSSDGFQDGISCLPDAGIDAQAVFVVQPHRWDWREMSVDAQRASGIHHLWPRRYSINWQTKRYALI